MYTLTKRDIPGTVIQRNLTSQYTGTEIEMYTLTKRNIPGTVIQSNLTKQYTGTEVK
jgi:hypothetical protein